MDIPNLCSHNDTYLWGFGEGVLNTPKPNEHYWVKFSGAVGPIPTLRESVLEACKLIANRVDRPIVVAFSGGYDSQVVLQGFRESKIPFTAVTRKMFFQGKLSNYTDVDNAVRYCKRFNIKHEILNMDVEPAFKECYELSKRIGRFNIANMPNLFLSRKYPEALFVVGMGTPDQEGPDDCLYNQYLYHQTTSLHRALGVWSIDDFYRYTPNLLLSYLYHPVLKAYEQAKPAMLEAYRLDVQDWTATTFTSEFIFNKYLKPLILEMEFGDTIMHVRKGHGFENIRPYYNSIRDQIDQVGPDVRYQALMTKTDWDDLYTGKKPYVIKRT